jgi:hypothetical protein
MNPIKKFAKFILAIICSETGRIILSILWNRLGEKVNNFLSGKVVSVEEEKVAEETTSANAHDLRAILTVKPGSDYLTYVTKIILTDIQFDSNPEFDYDVFCNRIRDAFIKIGVEEDKANRNMIELVSSLKQEHIPQADVYKILHCFNVHPGSVAVVYRDKEEIEKPYTSKIHVLD